MAAYCRRFPVSVTIRLLLTKDNSIRPPKCSVSGRIPVLNGGRGSSGEAAPGGAPVQSPKLEAIESDIFHHCVCIPVPRPFSISILRKKYYSCRGRGGLVTDSRADMNLETFSKHPIGFSFVQKRESKLRVELECARVCRVLHLCISKADISSNESILI